MTLKYNGSVMAHVRIKDGGTIIADRFVTESMTISIEGTLSNGKFAGPVEVYFVGILDLLEFYHTSFQTSCNSQFPGNTSGQFSIVNITSMEGGLVCCAPGNIDSVKPTILTCPSNKVVTLLPSQCSTTVPWTIPTGADNCSVIWNSTHQPNSTLFTPGTTVVTYTAEDPYGNQSTTPCTFTVTVNDVTPPTIVCPANITLSADAQCQAKFTLPAPNVSDNCNGATWSSNQPDDIFPLGQTIVIYTATDPSGNNASCQFTVTVEDKTKPTFVDIPADIFATANNSCKAKVSWKPPTPKDNCTAEPILTVSHDKDYEFPLGPTRVKFTAVDAAGNSDTCSFRVVITNPADPKIEGYPGTVTVNAEEKSDLTTATWEEPKAIVNCGEVTVEKSHAPGSKFPIGRTTVTYTFIDDTGKSSMCEFDVLVLAEGELFAISKVVTPDGDGINDVWQLANIENFKSNTVVVIDRWGNKIFQATGYDNERTVWDGTNNNGTVVPTGTYFYTIEVRDQDSVLLKKGFIEVIQ
jgi:gliding motility-associated-like protein